MADLIRGQNIAHGLIIQSAEHLHHHLPLDGTQSFINTMVVAKLFNPNISTAFCHVHTGKVHDKLSMSLAIVETPEGKTNEETSGETKSNQWEEE